MCVTNPNICLYANDMLTSDDASNFIHKELPFICDKWISEPTEQTLGAFSDAYWISRCIIKTEVEPLNNVDDINNPFGKWLSCLTIINEVPNISFNGAVNSPFWLKMVDVINNLKSILQEKTYILQDDTCFVPDFVNERECFITINHPNIIAIARNELTSDTNKVLFSSTINTLRYLIHYWAYTTIKESPLENFLFSSEGKTNIAYEKAINDICNSFWLVKAYIIVSPLMTNNDDRLLEVIQHAKNMCNRVYMFDIHLTNFIELCKFCDDRAKIRNKLKELLVDKKEE